MISLGLGIRLLPLMSVAEEVEKGRLWPLRITDQPLGADVFLVSNPLTPFTPPERRFVELLDELRVLYPDMI